MSTDLDWTEAGPRSRRYGDIYFSAGDGLAESRAIFLAGCGLPEAWRGRSRFTVAELGFGTGLNIAALLALWRETRDPGARLHIFSIEAHPLSRADATRALSRWPELADVASALLAAWPDGASGFHRLDLPGFDATLDLFVGEVGEALTAWSGRADAWFLDGFAPATNPQMWRQEVLEAVARLSAPGARLATFTVAGQVRRTLAACGFTVEKAAGFGRKRERLEGRFGGELASGGSRPAHVAIVGGGIAGAALVRAFGLEGVACTLVERAAPGAGASGNPSALVTPRLDAGFGPSAILHAQAFARAVDLYRRETPDAVIAQGALQFPVHSRDLDRFARIADWDGFAPDALALLDANAAGDRLGEAVEAVALLLDRALVVDPEAILRPWLAGAARVSGEVAQIAPGDHGWRCLDAEGHILVEADAVCLAAGAGAIALAPSCRLQPVRGQAEFAETPLFTGMAAASGAYAIPLRGGGVLFGASHLRGDDGEDIRDGEREESLQALARLRPALADTLRALPAGALRSRASLRTATPDHMPLAGSLDDRPGVYVLGGLGGRGFTLTPLLAEHVAALAVQAPSPLSVDVSRRLRPDRFALENRRGRRPLSPTETNQGGRR